MKKDIKKIKAPDQTKFDLFLFDGAFGTYYHKLSGQKEPCEMANINYPNVVLGIHKEYVEVGVDAIKTNTFGVNRYHFTDQILRDELIQKGFELASLATAGTKTKVFADIGYIEIPDEPTDDGYGSGLENSQRSNRVNDSEDNSKEALKGVCEEYKSIAKLFVHLGAKNFIFETLSEYETILPAVEYIKNVCPDAYIAVSFAVSQDGYTRKGQYYETLLRLAMSNPKIDLCGFNCVCGPSHLAALLRNAGPFSKPLCAMPNSGYPATINGRTVFQDNAQYFAEKLVELYRYGINYLGGCCGTTPRHMLEARESLHRFIENPDSDRKKRLDEGIHPFQKSLTGILSSKEKSTKTPATLTNRDKSLDEGNLLSIEKQSLSRLSFAEKLNRNEKVIAVELEAPLNADASFLIRAAKLAREAGADIVTIADSPLARTRADSIMLAAKVLREVDVDVMPHLSCRDRNHIGLKSSLLGAAIENIRNVLVVTGDPVPSADRTEGKGVFTYNSFQLISFIKSLNTEIFQTNPFQIAAALNVNAIRFDKEMERARRKMENGADLLLTQPLFSEDSIQNALRAKKEIPGKILFGILPVASYNNARFLNNEVSGIQIPDEFVENLLGKTPEEVLELSVEFSMTLVDKTSDVADGYYIMTPLKKIELVCELIRRIKKNEIWKTIEK